MATSTLMAHDVRERLVEDEGPTERLLSAGARALSDPELLAVLFGRGGPGGGMRAVAEELLSQSGGLKTLCQKDVLELSGQPGMSPRKAAQVAAALELGRRVMRSGESRPILTTPEEIYEYLAPTLCGLQREQFHVLCLNSRNALVADVQVAQGGVTSCPVDPRDVFHAAVVSRASAIVLAHNHPSGDPTPSVADLELTRQLMSGAQLFCIKVLDHLVIGDWSFCSLAKRGDLNALIDFKEARWNARGGSR